MGAFIARQRQLKILTSLVRLFQSVRMTSLTRSAASAALSDRGGHDEAPRWRLHCDRRSGGWIAGHRG